LFENGLVKIVGGTYIILYQCRDDQRFRKEEPINEPLWACQWKMK